MKAGKILGTRLGLLAALLLFLLGAGLVAIARGLDRGPAPAYPPAPMPTAPWMAMPTRAVATLEATAAPVAEPTPTPLSDLERLQQALLAGDLMSAHRAWEMLQTSPAVETQAAQTAGARLAFLDNDLETAEVRAFSAVQAGGTASENAHAWSLLGIILRRKGDYVASEEAFATALELEPEIEPGLFDDRWRNAVRTGDGEAMVRLAGTYSLRHPESEFEPYYLASALLADGEPQMALGVLLARLRERPDAQALLWYTLGDIYAALGGFREAATVWEVAASKVAHGDTTLSVVSDAPIESLSLRLARAYLATERCAEAESLYRRLSASYPELAEPLQQAVICQTPTPTPTPWIIRLQEGQSP
jgi:tetratricopeptide (TPR) repeat protein